MLDQSVNTFNKTLFRIFSDLKTLSTSLNGYVAGGLADQKLADTAQEAATDIAEGTEEIKTDDEGGGASGGDPRMKGVATSMGGAAAPQAIREEE